MGLGSAITAALAATALATSPAIAATPAPAPNLTAPPTVFDQVRIAGLAAQSTVPQHLPTAAAQADRARSATRYDRLSAPAAVDVLRDRVPEAVDQPAFQPLALPSGARITGYAADDRQAQVETAAGQAVVLDSTTPLRTVDQDTGLLAPVDLHLRDRDGAFVPVNDYLPVRLPEHLLDGVTVGDIGVRIDGAQDVTGQQIDDTVIWPNALTDTDVVARPVGSGADLSLTLRSQASPEAFPVSFDVSDGTTVRLAGAPDGGPSGLELVGTDGATVGTLSAPVAWDSDHVAVQAQWQVQDGKAALLVPHTGQDIAWPVVVDPQIADTRLVNDDRPAGYLAAHPWTWSNTPGFGAYYDTQMNQYTPYTNFAETTFSWWEVNLAGRQASILQIHADGESHSTSSGPTSCSYINIYYPDNGAYVAVVPTDRWTLTGYAASGERLGALSSSD